MLSPHAVNTLLTLWSVLTGLMKDASHHQVFLQQQPQKHVSIVVNPFPNDKLYSLKLKEFADDNFKFDENGRKLSKQVENAVGKGEIARYEQFLLFALCF